MGMTRKQIGDKIRRLSKRAESLASDINAFMVEIELQESEERLKSVVSKIKSNRCNMLRGGDVKQATARIDEGEKYVLLMCRFFNISHKDLVRKTRVGDLVQKRRYVGKILTEYIGLTTTEAADMLDMNHSSIIYHNNQLDLQLSDRAYGNTIIKDVYTSLLTYLDLPN